MSAPSLKIFRCGKCRQRYLFNHLCVTSKSRGKTRFEPVFLFACSSCGAEHRNPLTHRCAGKSDYPKRLAAAKRKAKAAKRAEARKARRAAAAKRRREAAARRKQAARERAKARKASAAKPSAPRQPRHEPATCRDPECTRYGCAKFRDGYEAGQLDCPYEHVGDAP